MKPTREGPSPFLTLLYRLLLFCVILLGAVLAGGTLYGVFFKPVPPDRVPPHTVTESAGREQTFTGIGQIRVSTADSQPGTVILFVTFLYHPEDKIFSEELVLMVKNFREIIQNYIGSFSVTELRNLGEEDLKTELLRRFNSILRLGQIKTLYLSDFIIVS